MDDQENDCMELVTAAISREGALYNVMTGMCLIPDMNAEGTLFGVQYGKAMLPALLEEGDDGLPMDPALYLAERYPAPGTCARKRLSFRSECGDFNAWDDDLADSCTVAAMLEMMEDEGDGWCLSDPDSIASACKSFA